MKTCVVCLSLKPLIEFYKRKDSPDGYRNDCKDCRKARTHQNYHSDLETKRAESRETYRKRRQRNPDLGKIAYAKHREDSLLRSREYYKKHRDRLIRAAIDWAKSNKGMANANKKAYKASKQRACPRWVRQDDELMWLMQEAYSLATLRTQMLGFPWHVDHKIPLRGKTVSGLHVPWNLAVIPGSENCSKSNKFNGAI